MREALPRIHCDATHCCQPAGHGTGGTNGRID